MAKINMNLQWTYHSIIRIQEDYSHHRKQISLILVLSRLEECDLKLSALDFIAKLRCRNTILFYKLLLVYGYDIIYDVLRINRTYISTINLKITLKIISCDNLSLANMIGRIKFVDRWLGVILLLVFPDCLSM